MTWYQVFFGWPNGQVWPNLVASGVTSLSAVGVFAWRVLARLETHHEARMAQDREHHTQLMHAMTTRGGDHDHCDSHR